MPRLTIITIGFRNNQDLKLTLKSIYSKVDNRIVSLVKDGGGTFTEEECYKSKLVSKKDSGIFDALNQGINEVDSDYFMFVHSGDELLISREEILDILDTMDERKLDITLGSQDINYGNFIRHHGVGFWKPWHLLFGSQPPHLPTIYRTSSVANLMYNTSNKVIGDYEYFEDLFKTKPKFTKYLDKTVIRMGPGGNTTSGWKSYWLVSKEHIKQSGLFYGGIKAISRLPLKILTLLK